MPLKITLPTVGILDRNFRYRPAAQTDIGKTFASLRRAQRQAELQADGVQQALNQGATGDTVVPLQAPGKRGAA